MVNRLRRWWRRSPAEAWRALHGQPGTPAWWVFTGERPPFEPTVLDVLIQQRRVDILLGARVVDPSARRLIISTVEFT